MRQGSEGVFYFSTVAPWGALYVPMAKVLWFSNAKDWNPGWQADWRLCIKAGKNLCPSGIEKRAHVFYPLKRNIYHLWKVYFCRKTSQMSPYFSFWTEVLLGFTVLFSRYLSLIVCNNPFMHCLCLVWTESKRLEVCFLIISNHDIEYFVHFAP